jgi:transposase-like protein
MAGRPSVFSEKLADEICRLIAEGVSLSDVCRREGMPVRQTVHDWVINNRDGFGDRYARARELQADRFAEELLEIADDTSHDVVERNGELVVDHEHIQRSKLRVDTRKWLMARMAPRKWGDKVVLAGDAESPLHTIRQINLVPVTPRQWDE